MFNEQFELPFEASGFTQSIESLIALKPKRRYVRKPDTSLVDLNLPLIFHHVIGSEVEYIPDKKVVRSETKIPSLTVIPDKGRSNEFGTPTVETIALIASKLLFQELHVLFYSRGNAETKQEIIDWIFATEFLVDQKPVKKSMNKIPFTAQFCCELEEIDYENLCDVISEKIEDMRDSKKEKNDYRSKSNIPTLWDSNSRNN